MSILIKGMEVPKNGELIVIYSDGYAEKYSRSSVAFIDFPIASPRKVIEVPTPHGRLIDADLLMREFEKAQNTMKQHGQEYSCSFLSSGQEISTEWYCVEDILDNAPTVIAAEGK